MDVESECSVRESVEDNEVTRTISAMEKVGNAVDDTKVYNNGSCVVENNDDIFEGVEEKGIEVISPPLEVTSQMPPSPVMIKGNGLRKWRRIKRDTNKGGDNIFETGKILIESLSNPGPNSSKRMQFSEEMKQKNEGSVSSTNAVERNLNGFVILDDSGLVIGPTLFTGMDSENSGDLSSKSSTAASAPNSRNQMSKVAGLPQDKIRMKSLSGKNLSNSVQREQQRKGHIDTSKKARGNRAKIKKENARSSVESDSRSSNFAFIQGRYSVMSNGMQNGSSINYDGQNGDDLSFVVKEERRENPDSAADHDPLVESIIALQSAQEALEKEVQKFREIGKEDVQANDSIQDFPSELDGQSVLEKPKTLASEQAQMLNRLEDAENKATTLSKEAEDLENYCEDIVGADESMKLHKRMCKYTACFFVQLLSKHQYFAPKDLFILKKLWIDKLSVPPQGSSTKGESELKLGMEEDDQTIVIQEKDKMYSKFCPVCNKGFNSGKAVGGHMRIHVLAKKKVNQPIKSKKRLREDEEISESDYVKKTHYNKKLSCLICGKNFLSMKSLCGHMRCHPERNWRGIQPPTIAKKSSWSKIEPQNVDNQIDSLTDADGNQTVASTESFPGLSVTAKRGMSPTSKFSGSEDDELYDAVLDLMMLAHGESFESGQLYRQRVVESEVTNSNSLTYKSEIGDTNKVSESKISNEESGSTNLEGLKSNKIGSFLRKSVTNEEHERTNAKKTIKNETRKKKVRLSDLESKKYAGPMTTKAPHVKYRCITCGKCFETRQALGRHRANHNKYKTAIYNSTDQSSFAASEDDILSTGIVQVDHESPEIAHKCRKILDFDLNEVPPLENEAGIESDLAANFDYGSSS
ncbi:unnamed protein product [Fraxinus pennsylvanica]|uniref:C2H2-type domain-containing protein n=1 Tax=Fraxinus pennsylvanica TaxID=56036 RepID=A0AAD2DMS3_9LAMI|nr:unnamed protein product [Fraxinus pennsylvanica]